MKTLQGLLGSPAIVSTTNALATGFSTFQFADISVNIGPVVRPPLACTLPPNKWTKPAVCKEWLNSISSEQQSAVKDQIQKAVEPILRNMNGTSTEINIKLDQAASHKVHKVPLINNCYGCCEKCCSYWEMGLGFEHCCSWKCRGPQPGGNMLNPWPYGKPDPYPYGLPGGHGPDQPWEGGISHAEPCRNNWEIGTDCGP